MQLVAKTIRRVRPALGLLCATSLLAFLTAVPAQAELAVASGSSVNGPSTASTTYSDWNYTLKAGETFDQAARELLRADISSYRLASYNGVSSSATLTSGDRIRIPVAWLRQQPEPARVTGVSGHAQRRPSGGAPLQPLSDGDRIRVGDTVITRDGTVTVELADGSIVRINPSSSVVFNRLTRYGRTGMTDTRMRLERGGLSNRVHPMIEEGARFEIETPSAIAAVRGTAFALQADNNGSHLQVTEGRVNFGQPGATRDIPAGYAASLGRTGTGELRIRQLPPAPDLAATPGTFNSLPGNVQWQANGSDSPRYQVDIIEADSGRWVRREQTSNNEVSLQGLANGDYRLEIASLAADGTQGMPASVPFQVDLSARAAELVEPGKGAALDTDRPRFSWRYQGENELARVEIAENPEFTNLVASSDWSSQDSATPSRSLGAGSYYWRVVTEAGGNSVATSETRTLTINGTLEPVRVLSANYVDRQVRIFWETIDQASSYLLQLSEDPSFEQVIKEATVNDTTAALRLIPGRRYFVRLRAVSDGPMAGRWGPGRELYVE
ncbi:FecR domain-containing protein [Marinobacter bryozoorum]|uniref:FecR family protein n=1 Tax=Marinobacter bryozoorum TaxID=256324 RepID=UPI002003AE6F|nr:FecR domain-containing protein [Marinobacter bryozoorum]MCK7544852.1 FecR domain-containing protein [Marinobacter bryozoorum]